MPKRWVSRRRRPKHLPPTRQSTWCEHPSRQWQPRRISLSLKIEASRWMYLGRALKAPKITGIRIELQPYPQKKLRPHKTTPTVPSSQEVVGALGDSECVNTWTFYGRKENEQRNLYVREIKTRDQGVPYFFPPNICEISDGVGPRAEQNALGASRDLFNATGRTESTTWDVNPPGFGAPSVTRSPSKPAEPLEGVRRRPLGPDLVELLNKVNEPLRSRV